MQDTEPTLDRIEDYNNGESKEKRRNIWLVVISGLVIMTIFGVIALNSTVSDEVATPQKTGIIKY
jgi:hypothetical protein